MKKIPIILLCLSASLVSCDKNMKLQEATMPPPIDSFSVSGIDVGQQADNFQSINDSTLCSYDLTGMNLVFFHKDAAGNYRAADKKEIDTEFWSMFFWVLRKRPNLLEYALFFGALSVQFRRMYERYLLANPEAGANVARESYPLISSKAAAG